MKRKKEWSKKNIILCILSVAIMCIGISACSMNNELIGTWEGESSGNTIIFKSDTVTVIDYGFSGNSEKTFSYKAEDGIIYIERDNGDTDTSQYEIDGDVLIMDGEYFSRQ